MPEIIWTSDVEKILETIRLNSIVLSEYHKHRYYGYKSNLKYFKLPLIVIASITSITSVGLSPYLEQSYISLLTCLLSLTSAILASIELYLGLQKNMEKELLSSKSFQLVSYDIFKMLALNVENRSVGGTAFLEETYNKYKKLVENANLIKNLDMPINDGMSTLPEHYTPNPPKNILSLLSPNKRPAPKLIDIPHISQDKKQIPLSISLNNDDDDDPMSIVLPSHEPKQI